MMKNYLKRQYKKIKIKYMNEINFIVPERYQSCFVHWGGGVDVQYIYSEFFKNLTHTHKTKILIVGVMGGRDYFLFINIGYDVVALDIGPQPDIKPIIISNVEENIPFPNGYFDAVLIGEVLEHLKHDVNALENIRRVLKDDGLLAVLLPFYNDWEKGHMRIHSPRSGRLLLEMCGFSIVDYLERPGLIWNNCLNLFQHGLSFMSYCISCKTAYRFLTKLIGRFEWFCGHLLWLRPIRKLSSRFGGYYLCRKSHPIDHITINKNLYTS